MPAPTALSTKASEEAAVAWRWLEAQLAGRTLPPVLTVIGLGDGSLLEALEAHAPSMKVLAIEPGPMPARTSSHAERMRAWRAAGRLVNLEAPGFDGADQAWRIFPTQVEAPPLVVHPSVRESPGLRDAVALLKKIVFGVLANASARRRLAPRYLANSLRNLPAIAAGRDVRELAGCAQGVPAVVVGAGPSLDRSIEELKRLGHRAFIVATDTSLRPLLLHGIVPHIVIALDPSEINGRHLLGLPECSDTWLLAESALDPHACAAFNGRTFWFRVAPHQPWPWLNQLGLDVGRLEVWGSVLTGAFEVAALAGCDPIVLVGSDLSCPDDRPYARGTTYEYYWAWQAANGTPVHDTWRAELARRAASRTERDLTGADTLTTGVMIEFRDWLLARARKSGRRVINATGRGMLFGDGVEQRGLSEALAGDAPRPQPLGELTAARAPIAVPVLAQALRETASHLANGRLDAAPLAGWVEFTAGAFDAAAVGSAIDEALQRLGSAPSTEGDASRTARPSRREMTRLTRLPEAASRLHAALSGKSLPRNDGVATTPEQRGELLIEALERLTGIVATLSTQADLVSGPNPARVAHTAAGAIGRWPETVRWGVLEFEGLLGEAWDRAVAAEEPSPFAAGSVSAREPVQRRAERGRPHTVYSCLLLALEWMRCAASLSDDGAAWLEINGRLRALERVLQPRTAPRVLAGPLAELVIEAGDGTRGTQLVLPLGISEAMLARVLTGVISTELQTCSVLGATTSVIRVRVVIRSMRDAAGAPSARTAAVMPRIVSLDGGKRLKVVGQHETGALAVVSGTGETVIVTSDGRVEPYQTWPKPITGALSLGERGDVAWSHAWSSERDGARPYLMYRKAPAADVTVVPLEFRPAQGLWWRNRLYLTSLPTQDAKGGVGVWAPGGTARFAFPNMTLQGLVDAGEALHLEPYIAGPTQGWGRKRAQWGWSWTLGETPIKRALGPRGASSGMTSARGWTATAYPQSDLVVVKSPSGLEFSMRCYAPLRVAWAGRSLVAFAAEGVVLLFEHLLDALEVADGDR